MELFGKNALITGTAKRIGRTTALALAEKGMNIAVHYNRSKTEALELVEEIEEFGRKAAAFKADVTKRKDIYLVMDKVHKEFGELHLLVNNAAVFGPSKISDVDDDEWDKYLNTNLKAPFYFAQKFAEICANDLSKIISIADAYGASPAANFIPYGISKGGVIHLTKGLAKAFAPKILVNCICPGPIIPAENQSKEQNDRAVEATLLKRWGDPEVIVKTVLFLAENDYITGQAIFVDGGKSV